MQRILLATNNQGKMREYRTLLQEFPAKLITPVEAGISVRVEEVGHSLEENAVLKAKTMASLSGLLALADDSGLEVAALDGAPGPLSARFAGEGASDEDRIRYLLKQLEGVPWERRTARFRCVIAIATPDGKVEICSGECSGIIAFAPRGTEGFGYDPVFYLPELGKTMAELPLPVKNRLSHRGKAARQVPRVLQKLQVIPHNG